jgi:hypothetical protein
MGKYVNGLLIRSTHVAVCIDQLYIRTSLSVLMAIFIVMSVKLNNSCAVLLGVEIYISIRYET